MYVAFEDEFRGDRSEIKKRLTVYLPFVLNTLDSTNNLPVLDVGCGRGEWLELLTENNIPCKGVDVNSLMTAQCLNLKLDVINEDAIAYLESLEENSLSVITGFHIIEHLSFSVLVKLYDSVLRVLAPGGMAIFETPNPENLIVGACNFYIDPTHINPIPPITTKFLLEYRGFERVRIERLHALSQHMNFENESQLMKQYLGGAMDSSVIAYKP